MIVFRSSSFSFPRCLPLGGIGAPAPAAAEDWCLAPHVTKNSPVKEDMYIVYMSRIMRKLDFCICEKKDADQLCCNREADQRLCFRYLDRTLPLLSKSEISSF